MPEHGAFCGDTDRLIIDDDGDVWGELRPDYHECLTVSDWERCTFAELSERYGPLRIFKEVETCETASTAESTTAAETAVANATTTESAELVPARIPEFDQRGKGEE